MQDEGSRTRRVALVWLLPLGITTILLLTTGWIWATQVGYQRHLLQRHADDICTQAARRLEVLIDAQLSTASAAALYWSGEERSEDAAEDFEELAAALMQEMSGYHALALFDASRRPVWVVQDRADSIEAYMLGDGRALFDQAPELGGVVISDPAELVAGVTCFVAVQRMIADGRHLGFLAAVFEVDELVEDAFQGAIGEEFDYVLQDEGEALFRVGKARFGADPERWPAFHSSESLQVGDRVWKLRVVPRAGVLPGLTVRVLLPLWGAFLSLGLGLTVALLSRRMIEIERSRSRHRRAEERRAELARRILRIQEEERARLSRELHDELGQVLTGVRVELDVLRRSGGTNPDGPELDTTYRLVDMALDSVRGLCRGLRPPALDDLGLVPAVRQFAGEFAARHHLELHLELDPELESTTFSGEMGVTFYRVLQEALTNVARHAHASRVEVHLHRAGAGELVLVVGDDGKGFQIGRLAGGDGVGLAGMRERARLVDGDLHVTSDREHGTQITLRAPVRGRGAGETS